MATEMSSYVAWSREIGARLGSYPYTLDERALILKETAKVESMEDLPEDVQALLAKPLTIQSRYTSERQTESRAAPVSKLERSIIKDSDQCPLCVANNDPRKVPVHPNCHCDVVTSNVEIGQVSRDHRLLGTVLNRAMDGVDIIGADDVSAVELQAETVAVFNPEDMRFADLQRWLEQVQPLLENANTYVSIVVDEDTEEAAQEVEEVVSLLATDLQAGLEVLQTKKFWLSIAKAAI